MLSTGACCCLPVCEFSCPTYTAHSVDGWPWTEVVGPPSPGLRREQKGSCKPRAGQTGRAKSARRSPIVEEMKRPPKRRVGNATRRDVPPHCNAPPPCDRHDKHTTHVDVDDDVDDDAHDGIHELMAIPPVEVLPDPQPVPVALIQPTPEPPTGRPASPTWLDLVMNAE